MQDDKVTPKFLTDLERHVLAHRYLYYVLGQSVIPDAKYDYFEQRARSLLPSTSPVHQIGSSFASDYPADVIRHASRLLSLHTPTR